MVPEGRYRAHDAQPDEEFVERKVRKCQHQLVQRKWIELPP